jgi:hypothetical protein
MEPKHHNHRPPPYLSELQAQWRGRLQQLRADDARAEQAIESLISSGESNKNATSTRLHQAQIERHKIAEAYNDFLDTDRQYNRQGNDAARALERPNLSLLERHQLETTRDHAWATAGEFQRFKSEQQLRPIHLAPVHTDTQVFAQGQEPQLNAGTVQGQTLGWLQRAGQALHSAADFVANRLLATPSRVQNEKACAMALNSIAGIATGRLVPNMGGPAGARLGDGAWDAAIEAGNPAATTCARLYSEANTSATPHHASAQTHSPASHLAPEIHQHWALAQQRLSPALREQGHTQPQIDSVCAAAACNAQQHARLGDPTHFMLSKDGKLVGVMYGHVGVRDFAVQEALRHSPQEHLQQAQAMHQEHSQRTARVAEHPTQSIGAPVLG